MIPAQKLKSAEKNKTDMEHYGTCVDTGNNTALLRFCPQNASKNAKSGIRALLKAVRRHGILLSAGWSMAR